MFNENEVAMLLLCCGVFIFIITKRRDYKRIPHAELLLAAFYLFFGAVLLTVAEELFFPVILNVLEHLLYVFSSGVLFIWCWLFFRIKEVNE